MKNQPTIFQNTIGFLIAVALVAAPLCYWFSYLYFTPHFWASIAVGAVVLFFAVGLESKLTTYALHGVVVMSCIVQVLVWLGLVKPGIFN